MGVSMKYQIAIRQAQTRLGEPLVCSLADLDRTKPYKLVYASVIFDNPGLSASPRAKWEVRLTRTGDTDLEIILDGHTGITSAVNHQGFYVSDFAPARETRLLNRNNVLDVELHYRSAFQQWYASLTPVPVFFVGEIARLSWLQIWDSSDNELSDPDADQWPVDTFFFLGIREFEKPCW
jgi:hypothetical protein